MAIRRRSEHASSNSLRRASAPATGVSAAASKLQSAGLIRYRRGVVTILDRQGLMRRACECYGVLQKEYERLLPPQIRPTSATTQPRTGAVVTRRSFARSSAATGCRRPR